MTEAGKRKSHTRGAASMELAQSVVSGSSFIATQLAVKRDSAQPNRPYSMISPISAGYSTGMLRSMKLNSVWQATVEDVAA